MRDTSRCTRLRLGRTGDRLRGIHRSSARRQPPGRRSNIYLSARSNVEDGSGVVFKGTWLRLTRRCVRDMNFRGDVHS